MRRPLKPFVTEYKGTRRLPSSQPAPEPTPKAGEFRVFDSERSRPRSIDTVTREETEDSYEAAMRAADALFARPAPQPEKQRFVAAAEATEGSDDGPAPVVPERGGRILRALDEQPSPQLVALEAANAPKRRGRKPGSKNKPKTNVIEIATDPSVEVPPHAALAANDAASPAAELIERRPSAAPGKLEAISTPSPSSGSRRFPWVRDRLKPGEGWKRRRLPRICW